MTNRRYGVFVPVLEVEAYLVCGWSIADDLIVRKGAAPPVRLCGTDDVVLLAPPRAAEGEAA